MRRVRTIASWNVYVGQDSAEVRRGVRKIIKRHHPDVIALQEASGDIRALRALAKRRGYRLKVGKRAKPRRSVAGQESQSNVIMIHKRIPLLAWWAFSMTRPWIGPKHGIERPGRTFVTAITPGLGVTVVHMPTGRRTRANRPAWKQTMRRLRKQARRRLGLPMAWVGDWNNPHTDESPGSVARAFAERVGGTVVHANPPLDYAVVRGMDATAQEGGRLGSDHRYVLIILNRK